MPDTITGKKHLRKLTPSRQITIPKVLIKGTGLVEGGYLEFKRARDGILIKPVMTEQAPAMSLSPEEQTIVLRAKQKIIKIKTDLLNSRGLTEKEADLAVKTGLISAEQRYFWLEDWQVGERQAQRDIKEGKVKTSENAQDLINDLRT